MAESEEEQLRYPVGRYNPPQTISADQRSLWTADLESLPRNIRQAVSGLSDSQLDTPYRPGGWTVRQVVHHVPESHMNSYIRFRLALTEDKPNVKTYDEAAWAKLPDSRSAPIDMSLRLLDVLHTRWIWMLRSMSEDDFARAFRHPEWGDVRLDWALGQYAWHSRHHVAHIARLRSRNGW